MKTEIRLPIDARVTFAHAVAQHLADRAQIDLLHIKGLALDRSLTSEDRVGNDADLMVRPSKAASLIEMLTAHGWRIETTFRSGSPFGHATTLRHPVWASADVHRLFPGITAEPEEAFVRLWRDRHQVDIGGLACAVPSLEAQTMILVLNAARSSATRSSDVEVAWHRATDARQIAVRRLVNELGAEVAFAAATGGLERFRDHPDHDLWRVTVQGGSRFEEWRARIKAEPNRRAAAQLALRALLVNTDHLAAVLGRPPTKSEVVREFFARPARAVCRRRGASDAGHSR